MMLSKEWVDDYKLKAEVVLDPDFTDLYDTAHRNLAKIILRLLKELGYD